VKAGIKKTQFRRQRQEDQGLRSTLAKSKEDPISKTSQAWWLTSIIPVRWEMEVQEL
jgi:hypothetical protein